MKKLLLVFIATFSSMTFAAAKPCEELQTEISAKLEAKGVKNYSLEILPADQVGDHKVVGSCEGGAKKIIYVKK